MKFNDILEEILLEAITPQEIHGKYYKDIPYEEFIKLCKADPQTVERNNEIVKIGKYAKLLIQMYRSKKLMLEDLPRAKEYLEYVYKHNITLDSNKIKTLNDLYDVVKQYIARGAGSNLNTILTTLSPEEYKLIHDGKDWMIYNPLTERASCYLGVSTDWCTTWGPHSLNKEYRERDNYFQRYYKDGPLYIMINKNDNTNKYQFHFESKQYMDKDDKRIDTKKFLSENPEIKKFFFPSLFGKVSKEELQKELIRISVLPDKDSLKILKTAIKGGIDNPLVLAISNQNEEEIEKLIVDKNMTEPPNINDENITFWVKRLDDDVERVHDTLSYYEHDANSGSDRVWDDISNADWEWNEELEPSFKKYYEENREDIRVYFSIPNYEMFKNNYFDNFINNEKIKDEYMSSMADLSTDSYEKKAEEYVDDIKKYIDFDGYSRQYSISVNMTHFIQFLMIVDIKKIEDNLNDVLSKYIDHYNVQTEYEGIYDYDRVGIIYGSEENERFNTEVDDYFEILKDDLESNTKCFEAREILNRIVKDLFKGSSYYENDHVIIKLPSMNINCDDQTIYIEFTNKDTGKNFKGNVKVDNLSSYAINYQLFETYITFKKNIL